MAVKAKGSGISTTSKFTIRGIRALGFDVGSCIREFIDNSIDAGATNIDITYKQKQDSNGKKYYEYKQSDDGSGILSDNIVNCFMQLGTDLGEYHTDSIGNFGVGATAGYVNLLQKGGKFMVDSQAKTKKDKYERSTLAVDVSEDDTMDPNYEHNDVDVDLLRKSFTDIQINRIYTNLTPETLRKKLAVVYYPSKVVNDKFNITLNGKEIEFIDPFYREWDHQSSPPYPLHGVDYKRYSLNVKVDNDDVIMNVLQFYPKFDGKIMDDYCSSWDKSGSVASLKKRNAGIYFKLGGRYIQTGDFKFVPGKNPEITHQRLRIEVEIPRRLMKEFSFQVNKSKITIDEDNQYLQSFIQEVKKVMSTHIRDFKSMKKGNTNTPSQEKELEDLNHKLNQIINGKVTSPFRSEVITKQVNKRKSRKRNGNRKGIKPTGNGTSHQLGSNTHARKKKNQNQDQNYRFKFESFGYSDWWYNYQKDDAENVINIIFNTDNPYVKEYFVDYDSKQMFPQAFQVFLGVHQLFQSMKEIYETDNPKQNVDDIQNEFDEKIEAETMTFRKIFS